MSEPLILTLQLDPQAQAFYDDLRIRHFPPARNLIPAHLTLFHHLPDQASTVEVLRQAAAATPPFPLANPTPRSIGRGVAVFFHSDALAALHVALSQAFQPHLIPQDRQRLRPHIVVQNKVDPEIARRTLPLLQSIPLPEPHAIGLTLWRYLGGPWELLSHMPFVEIDLNSSIKRT